MTDTELRRQLERLTQQFVDGVIEAINSVPLGEIAVEVGGKGAPAVRVPAGRVRGRGARGRGAARAAGAAAAGRRRRKLKRRPSEEIERLRNAILNVLQEATAPIGAAEIARRIGEGVRAPDLAFPMAQLRKQGLVRKEGERTQAVYSLARRGRKAK